LKNGKFWTFFGEKFFGKHRRGTQPLGKFFIFSATGEGAIVPVTNDETYYVIKN
jgi:hypothetical protein